MGQALIKVSPPPPPPPYSIERVAGAVPEKHKKLIAHIEKMNERQKRKKKTKQEQVGEGGGGGTPSNAPAQPSNSAHILGKRGGRKHTTFLQAKVNYSLYPIVIYIPCFGVWRNFIIN